MQLSSRHQPSAKGKEVVRAPIVAEPVKSPHPYKPRVSVQMFAGPCIALILQLDSGMYGQHRLQFPRSSRRPALKAAMKLSRQRPT